MKIGETTYIFLLFLLPEFVLVHSQCSAQKIVNFDDIRPTSRAPVFCAATNAGVTQLNDQSLAGCSRGCADSDACVGFNYKEHQLICELFQTTFEHLTLTPGCTYYQVSHKSVALSQYHGALVPVGSQPHLDVTDY